MFNRGCSLIRVSIKHITTGTVKTLIQLKNRKDYQSFYAMSEYLYVKAPGNDWDQK